MLVYIHFSVFLIFINISLIVVNAGYGGKCITPNGELAKCLYIDECESILKIVQTKSKSKYRFARESNCGFQNCKSLVCCGSNGDYTEKLNTSTSIPSSSTTSRITTTTTPATITTTKSAIPDKHKQPSSLLADRKICGFQVEKRIVGGKITGISEFPWLTLLRFENLDGSDAGFKCGGSIINNQYILTAAHCTTDLQFKPVSVRLGEWNITSTADCKLPGSFVQGNCADPVVDIKIKKILNHKFYQPTTENNDIALLKLERKFDYTDYIKPICLSDDTTKSLLNEQLTVAGWGKIDFNGPMSPVKLKVNVPFVPLTECRENLESHGIKITNNMMCAGGKFKKDSCEGDSGGPLMLSFKNVGRWFQLGIVSKGKTCGLPDTPAVYTNVARYYKWILKTIKKNGY